MQDEIVDLTNKSVYEIIKQVAQIAEETIKEINK